jgi:hypothetical protein
MAYQCSDPERRILGLEADPTLEPKLVIKSRLFLTKCSTVCNIERIQLQVTVSLKISHENFLGKIRHFCQISFECFVRNRSIKI